MPVMAPLASWQKCPENASPAWTPQAKKAEGPPPHLGCLSNPTYGPKSEMAFDSDFANFAKRADITPFAQAKLPIPKTGQVYSDDMFLLRYQKSARNLSWKQRNVPLDGHCEFLSYDDEPIQAALTPLSSFLPKLLSRHPLRKLRISCEIATPHIYLNSGKTR